jgi:hypothetical protein
MQRMNIAIMFGLLAAMFLCVVVGMDDLANMFGGLIAGAVGGYGAGRVATEER